jgi:ferric-dicitrate binding protein FerR (iron transport regulator)
MKREDNWEEIYREYAAIWHALRWDMDALDRKTAWEAIIQRFRRRKRMRRTVRYMTAAACLVLAVGVGIHYFYHPAVSGTPDTQTQRTSDIRLVLSSGEEVRLNDHSLSEIREKNVSIVRDSARLVYQPENTTPQQSLVYNELIIPRGGEYELILSDGSKVVLNAGTRFRFPVTFPAGQREVYLEGEAYFEVEKQADASFVIHTEKLNVNVLGTSFNVSAYRDENKTVVTLVKGVVQINNDNTEEMLVPGEQYRLDHPSMTGNKTIVNTNVYTAWTKGIFRFDAMPLEELMKNLSRWFDIRYTFKDEQVKNKRFTGGFRKYDDVYQVLKIIGDYTKVSFSFNEGEVIIDKK